jgi:hypothetical protein
MKRAELQEFELACEERKVPQCRRGQGLFAGISRMMLSVSCCIAEGTHVERSHQDTARGS